MQLDKLQLALRPRPGNQAIDLGYSLLRAHAAQTYAAWIALWLPLVALFAALSFWQPQWYRLWLPLVWWLRALAERAPLYVLSRRVFGETVSWRDAVKAWPSQLSGGWISMLTWRRPLAAARSFFTPIWQLEGARGKVAAERRRVLGRNGASGSAIWFGICCLLFEIGLVNGLLAFISIFFTTELAANPLALLIGIVQGHVQGTVVIGLLFSAYAIAGAVVGPVYVAGGFTLYLNRRATLEAWDLEIALRQIHAPHAAPSTAPTTNVAAKVLGAFLLVLACAYTVAPAPAQAAATSAASSVSAAKPGECKPPRFVRDRAATRQPALDADQEAKRRALQAVYDAEDLRGYSCASHLAWESEPDKKEKEFKPWNLPDLDGAALVLKLLVIAAAIIAVCLLAYRFRDKLHLGGTAAKRNKATEIAGLDIRPESLPEDVPTQVLALWHKGARRQALALLYRATISRLVHDDNLAIQVGATEGDCLRLAERAARTADLSTGRLGATRTATDLWLRAAYAARWPELAALEAGCREWGGAFDGKAVPPLGGAQ